MKEILQVDLVPADKIKVGKVKEIGNGDIRVFTTSDIADLLEQKTLDLIGWSNYKRLAVVGMDQGSAASGC